MAPDYNISRGVGWQDYVPFFGNAQEKELRNVRELKRKDPSLANKSDQQILDAYRNRDRGFLGHFGHQGGHKGQLEMFKSDIQAAEFDRGAAKRRQQSDMRGAIENQKVLDNYRFDLRKQEMGMLDKYNVANQQRQHGYTKELMGAQFGQQKELTGLQLQGQKDIAQLQGNIGLKQTELAGRQGLDQTRLQGEFGLKQAQIGADAQRYGVDQQMKDARRSRRHQARENAMSRRHQTIFNIYGAGQQAAAGRRQMISSILNRR